MNEDTTVRVKRETRRQLGEVGSKEETFDEIIQRLIDFYKKNSRSKRS